MNHAPIAWPIGVAAGLLAVAFTNPVSAATDTAAAHCFPVIHGRVCYTSSLVPGWSRDAKQSHTLGIAALFHRTGDERRNQPMITLDAAQHFPWLNVSTLVSQNVAGVRKTHPDARIEAMSLPPGLSARGVIVSYRGLWQTLVARQLGKIIVLTTLQCGNSAQCAPLVRYFLSFLSSMKYTSPSPDARTAEAKQNALHSGIVYGQHWEILFSKMPWMPDTTLANRLGVNEIFYPSDWDPHALSPFISLAYDKKTSRWNLRRAIAWDVARSRKHGDVVTSVPPLSWHGGHAALRIFSYKGGWDEVVYSDGGKVIFYVTLHCNDASQCKAYQPLLKPFVQSLSFVRASVTIESPSRR